jgi:hypothetical protein
MYLDHAAEGEGEFHRSTMTRLGKWLNGDLQFDENDLQKWVKWLEKTTSRPEFLESVPPARNRNVILGISSQT